MEVFGIISRLVVVILISTVLSIIAMQVIKLTGAYLKDFKQRNKPLVLTIAGFFNLLFIIAVAFILKIWDHEALSILGFSIQINDLIFLFTALVLAIGLAFLFVWYFHSQKVISVSWSKRENKSQADPMSLILVFIILFIAALQEEVLFRGYFAFVLKPLGFYYALLISAVVFTAWHFITNKVNVYQTIDWFLGGIMLFYIYWISGSIWVAALVHFSRNITNVIVFNISGNQFILSYEKPLPPQNKTIYTITYSLIIILLGSYFYHL